MDSSIFMLHQDLPPFPFYFLRENSKGPVSCTFTGKREVLKPGSSPAHSHWYFSSQTGIDQTAQKY